MNRISTLVLRLKGVSFHLVSVYLISGVGLDEDNPYLFMHLLALVKLIGLPVIMAGDFNLTLTELEDFGFPKQGFLQPIFRGRVPTTTLSTARDIDHMFVSIPRLSLFLNAALQLTRLRPHLGVAVRMSIRSGPLRAWQPLYATLLPATSDLPKQIFENTAQRL